MYIYGKLSICKIRAMEKRFLQALQEQQARRERFHTQFLMQVLFVSATLLVLVGSLGSYSSSAGRIVFLLMLALNVVGILAISTALYLQVRAAIRLETKTKEYISAALAGDEPDEMPFEAVPKYSRVLEVAGYASVVAALVLLVALRAM